MAGERKLSPWNTRKRSVIDESEHHRELFRLRTGLIFEGMNQKTESEADFVLFDAIPQTASKPSFFFVRDFLHYLLVPHHYEQKDLSLP